MRPGLLLLAVLLAGATHAAPPPVYVRLGLPPDGKRVLNLKLECTTDPLLRDVIYADRNGDGQFTAAERLTGRRDSYKSSDFRACQFPEISLPAWPADQGLACRVRLHSGVFGKAPSASAFSGVVVLFSQARAGKAWSYAATADLPLTAKGTATLGGAPRIGVLGPLAARIQTKPDPDHRGRTGFAVTLGWPQGEFVFAAPPAPVGVQLRVVGANGRVVLDDLVPLDKLEFG